MNVSDLLIGISLAQAIFIILITFSKAKRRVDDVIILVWILLLVLPVTGKLVAPVFYGMSSPVLTYNLPYPLLHGPMLWIYTCSLTGKNIHLNLDTFRHAMPFVLGCTVQLVTVGPGGWVEPGMGTPAPSYQLIETLILVTSLIYSARVLWHIREYESQGQFKELSTKITLKWLNWLTILMVVLPSIQHILGLSIWAPSYGIAFAVFIFILEYFSIRKSMRERINTEVSRLTLSQTQLNFDMAFAQQAANSPGPMTQPTNVKAPEEPCKKEKYERSGLTEQRSFEYLDRLLRYMSDEKPYLDANLTIDQLASQVSMTRNHLSQILSEQLDKNFHSFINEYRIATVKSLISNTENKKVPLLSLAYESGFNSKSTFNTAFKKIEGTTPSQYRKLVSEEFCAA